MKEPIKSNLRHDNVIIFHFFKTLGKNVVQFWTQLKIISLRITFANSKSSGVTVRMHDLIWSSTLCFKHLFFLRVANHIITLFDTQELSACVGACKRTFVRIKNQLFLAKLFRQIMHVKCLNISVHLHFKNPYFVLRHRF